MEKHEKIPILRIRKKMQKFKRSIFSSCIMLIVLLKKNEQKRGWVQSSPYDITKANLLISSLRYTWYLKNTLENQMIQFFSIFLFTKKFNQYYVLELIVLKETFNPKNSKNFYIDYYKL